MADQQSVSITVDQSDPVASSVPSVWAIEQLTDVLKLHGIIAERPKNGHAVPGSLDIVVGGKNTSAVRSALEREGITLPDEPEAMALASTMIEGRRVLLACGRDTRGLTYAVLELADRVSNAVDREEAMRTLQTVLPIVERPANRIRSVLRMFASDVEDMGWYHDRTFWTRYLSMLATQRFNRFQLALGIGFDFARAMRDSYFYFPYPFLFSVPGYDVRATGISDTERDRNFETLLFVTSETKRRGLHFQLGLWANVYEFHDSPDVNHVITGLHPDNHAAYCRDAVRLLLQRCPDIDGLTIRVHGESGIPEGSYDFWRTYFSGIATCRRAVEIDMHAKGIDQGMIDVAKETGLPLIISPKFWAEHMGLPYHQADIRAVERPGPATGQHATLMALSIGSRRFTRYGYADLFKEQRPYGVLFRIWPGTHRLLLWGDPVTGAAYSRAGGFCGADGIELFEPLSFSGRRGSGLPDGHQPYLDTSLAPEDQQDAWEKYRYWYRLWGRLLYNPDAEPDVWRRYLRREFGAAAPAMDTALGAASRILPLVTTVHHPSAANNSYWPEIYTDMPIVDESRPHPYRDTASPRRFGNVSPLDPQLFLSADDFVGEVLSGARSGRYSPLEVAHSLDELAANATESLSEAKIRLPGSRHSDFRRWAIDVAVEAALGRFFAGKFRAAVGFALFSRTRDVLVLHDAVEQYRAARTAWVDVVHLTRDVYKPDLTFGPERQLRGHWADRLGAIDQDLHDMEHVLASVSTDKATPQTYPGVLSALRSLMDERRPYVDVEHQAPDDFTPGDVLVLTATVSGQGHTQIVMHLSYRHVNQAERFQNVDMRQVGDSTASHFTGAIPGSVTQSPFPLQYYFGLHDANGAAWLWPGFDPDLANQPYVVVQARGAKVPREALSV